MEAVWWGAPLLGLGPPAGWAKPRDRRGPKLPLPRISTATSTVYMSICKAGEGPGEGSACWHFLLTLPNMTGVRNKLRIKYRCPGSS
jgi:hypothetical protein